MSFAGLGLLTDPRNTFAQDILIDGQAPKWGQVFRNPSLANTFRVI